MTSASYAAPDAKVVVDGSVTVVDAKAPAKAAPTKAAPTSKAPATKAAPGEPADVPEAVKTGKNVWSDFKDGKYREAIAGCILMLLFLWRRFASKFIVGKLSTWQVGFVAVLLGFLGTIPEALAVEPWNWKTFLYSGLATSGEAILFWKTLGQKVLPKVFGEIPKEEEA
jgi:hypothetical protein